MAGIFRARTYFNDSYLGLKKFVVPTNANFNTYANPGTKYFGICNAIGDVGFTLLSERQFYPISQQSIKHIATLGEIPSSVLFELTNYCPGVLKLEIDSDDRKKRVIEITTSRGLDSGMEKTQNLTFNYYLNDSLKLTYSLSLGVGCQYYSWYGELHIRLTTMSIPWISKDGNRFGGVTIEANGVYNVDYTELSWDNSQSTLSNYTTTDSDLRAHFNEWLDGFEPLPVDDENPYFDGGVSVTGGGDGNFSEDSDDVDVDQLPTVDAVGTGFATLFTPSKSQLKDLADIMWDSNIFTALQNLVENITGMFTSLAIVPFTVTAGNTVEVTWFGFALTEIFLTLAAQQYYEFDMGSIDMKNDSRIFTSGSALDYSPFSSLGIFLPFIGFQELDIDECRDAVINLKYRIDILSGTCVALISLNGNTVYQFTGNCLSQIPITNENMQSLVTDAVQVGIAAAATHSAKGAVGAAESAMEGAEGAKETKAAKAALGHAEAHLAQTKAGLASATANASMGMKPVYGKAGAISASASLLAVKQPYLFLRTPRQSIPDHYQRYCGFPSNMSGKLSSFSGYTVVEDIRLNGLVATSPEVAEIYELLKGGVII